MSTKSSLAYIEYERKGGNLHIYFESMDKKYYIADEFCSRVELPEDIAKDFAEILNTTKYKHLVPKSSFEIWKEKQKKR